MFCVETFSLCVAQELFTVNLYLTTQRFSFELCSCISDTNGTISVPWLHDLIYALWFSFHPKSISVESLPMQIKLQEEVLYV